MTKHINQQGLSGTPTYKSWKCMLNRCESTTDTAYQYYGGRGIKVCERWHEFKNFLADMGERPSRKSLDRINNDGNYEPGNCRWATRKEQARVHIKEYCLRGHKLSETGYTKNKRGDRVCRECGKIRWRKWKAKLHLQAGK